MRWFISPQYPLKAPYGEDHIHRDHYCGGLGDQTRTQELGRAKFPGLTGRVVGLARAYLDHVLVKSCEGSRLKIGESTVHNAVQDHQRCLSPT